MKFDHALDHYLRDQRSYGRINSDRTEVSYRSRLNALGDEVGNRDPRTISRAEVKRTLARWDHPNTQRHAHSVYVAFFDWCMEEGVRKDNPARQIRRAKKRPTNVYRLTREEAVALMDASMRDRRAMRTMHLGLLAGLRRQELCGLQGRHLLRPGFVWVSADIAKGQRERYVPVLSELEPVIAEILERVAAGEYVIPARRPLNPPLNTRWRLYPERPTSPKALWELVGEVGKWAGIAHPITPHTLRHSYGDALAKYAGLRATQELMGHASVDTTADTYTSRPGLDELSVSVHGFRYREGYPPANTPAIPHKATTGIEPVVPAPDQFSGYTTPDEEEVGHDGPPRDAADGDEGRTA